MVMVLIVKLILVIKMWDRRTWMGQCFFFLSWMNNICSAMCTTVMRLNHIHPKGVSMRATERAGCELASVCFIACADRFRQLKPLLAREGSKNRTKPRITTETRRTGLALSWSGSRIPFLEATKKHGLGWQHTEPRGATNSINISIKPIGDRDNQPQP